MSFAPIETSRHEGEPINLFYFKYGEDTTAFFAYTDSEQQHTYAGVVYSPLPIDRGAVTSSGTLDKATLEIMMPHNAEIAELFKVSSPAYGVSLFIRQGHLDDPDNEFNVIWAGRVVSCGFEDSEAKLSCEPISTVMKRKGLRRCYQYGCPHSLYGPHCRANETVATFSSEITLISGNRVTMDAGWHGPHDPDKFIGGRFKWTRASGTEVRTILKLYGSSELLLSGLPYGASIGDTVEIALGCAHTVEDCEDLHNNVQNFGGCPWIPLNSPIHVNPYH